MLNGKPDNNYRYIFTKVDNRPQFVITDICNHCPFLISESGYDAKCSKYVNPKTNSNKIQMVYGYMYRTTPTGKTKLETLTNINIPSWCDLPNHISKVTPKNNINYIKNGKLKTDSGESYALTVSIISGDKIEFSEEDLESLVTKKDKPKYVNYGNEVTPPIKTKNTEICSLCGEDKEGVDRNKKRGMCKTCYSENKKNKKKLYSAYINNFRLKRRETWKNQDFKKINTL
jgi:hypothetical protein